MANTLTIADIHRIRVENYEATKMLSPKELVEKTRTEAAAIWKEFREAKAARLAAEAASLNNA